MTNVPISGLNPGASVKSSDIFPDVQEVGIGPVKVTAQQIKDFTSNDPNLVTPDIGVATGTSLALNGAALGSNSLAVNGSADFNGPLNLGTQQLIQGELILSNESAGNYPTTLKSSNSSTESWTLTFPPDNGTNGYVLTTDGSGVSSWTNPTSLGIDIDVNSTAITGGTSGRIVYDNAGKFGEISAITTNGSDTLTVGTQHTTQGNVVLSNTSAGAFPVTLKSSNSTSVAWSFTFPTTAGTNKYALTTDGSGISSWSQIDLAAAVTGTLPVNHGGTGQTTLSAHGVVIGNAASGVNVTATGSSGQVFQSGGAAADPVWTTATFPSTATGTGTILRADGTNWVATTAAYPSSTTINQILYSNSNNNVTGLTTGNGGVLNTNSTGVPSITSNPTLGVQQTTQGSIVLANTAAGAFSTTIKSSNSATEAWSLTLPVSKGTNGYILTTDGTGISSWTNPTSLGIDIDVNSTAITSGTSGRLLYDNSATVGETTAITTNGTGTLTIGTQQTTQGSLVLANTAVGAFATTIQSSNSASAAWTLTLPATGGTNNYVLTTNGSGTSSWSQVSLTAGVTGVLPAANGGTGQSTNTIHGVLIGNAGNAINATTAGSAGQLLASGGASADPLWTTATFPSTATGTGTILRADGTNWSATTATYPTTTTAGTILVSATANAVTGTATPTLGVQQTTQGQIILANTAAGAFPTTLQSSNSASAAWTLTLPTTAGTNNYVLTTNGSGVSSWAQVSLTAGVTGTLPVANGGTGTATAFTAGSVVFAGASGVYSQNSNGLFWDNSNTRLGIGTNVPAYTLDVSGNVRLGASNKQITVYVNTSTNWNYSNLDLIRNASNTSTPRFLGMPLDGDSLGSTSIGDYNAIWGAYDSAPTTSSTSASLNGYMVYAAYAGHRWYQNGSEVARLSSTSDFWVGTNSSPFNLTVSKSKSGAGVVSATINTSGNASSYAKSYVQCEGASSLGAWTQYSCNGVNSWNAGYDVASSSYKISNDGGGTLNTTTRLIIDGNGSVVVGTAALATNATDGFLYVPTCAGTPTGTPTAKTGTAPIVINTTNNKLYFYSGGAWRDAGP